ncbi:MAG: PASTA domain-containing protein [Acidobacteriota bacterium]
MRNFFRILSLLVLLLAIALLSAITTMHFAIHGAEVQVPALRGMTVAQARSETAGLRLNLIVDNRYYSGEVAAGHILTQSPNPGTIVRHGWRVRVAESLGPQQVQVPNTVGMSEQAAELTLRRAGIDVGQPAYLPAPDATAGTVLAQDPPAHAEDIAQPTVSLLIAAPNDQQPDGWVMPDLAGMLAPAAESTLIRVGIKVAPLTYVDVPVAPVGSGNALPQAPVKPGAVIAQSPAAGARVEQTDTVHLTVAR